jgi:hypothetical protein
MHDIESLTRVESREQARQVALLDRARAAIDEATTVADVQKIKDTAEAARIFAKRIENGEALGHYATQIVLRSKRRMGEMLAQMPKASGGQPYQSLGVTSSNGNGHGHHEVPPSLADLGISRNDSSAFQRIAKLPEAEFENALCEADPSIQGLLRRAREPIPPAAKPKPTAEQLLRTARHHIKQLIEAGSELETDEWSTASSRARRWLERNVRER